MIWVMILESVPKSLIPRCLILQLVVDPILEVILQSIFGRVVKLFLVFAEFLPISLILLVGFVGV